MLYSTRALCIAILLFLQQTVLLKAQDTFSILAFDSITREVGAAGASCVDLFAFPGYNNDFICELFPDTGAIACQAAYLTANQSNARSRMRAGDTPQQLIGWLNANDIANSPDNRQYGVIRFVNGTLQKAAFTGTACLNYKNHVVGRNYTIHGNILLGQKVLDSMEARFKRTPGDLACKLMSAMQGANMVGADSRCASNNSSSLFAFLKVSQPGDLFGAPSLLISLKTPSGAKIEPIDSLQTLFNEVYNCSPNTTGLHNGQLLVKVQVFPNPAHETLQLSCSGQEAPVAVDILNAEGRQLRKLEFCSEYTLNLQHFPKGMYLAVFRLPGGITLTRRFTRL